MDKSVSFQRLTGLAAGVCLLVLAATGAEAQDRIKVGVVSFLSGPAAGPFGVPGKNGAEMVIDAINRGALPAPYNTKGFAGAMMDPVYTDEAGGGSKQVAEYRNLVEKQNVDMVVGYISSGNCMAIAPVADELKKLTIVAVCGTPRLFEEKPRTHVFRTQGNAVGDSIAAARYIAGNYPKLKKYAGINQNYAWGQDSWKYFNMAMAVLQDGAEPSPNPQFPKIFSGQYSAEISALSLDKARLVHTSLWGGDIEAFVLQALVRGFFDRKQLLSVADASAVDSLGKKFPDGVIAGERGEYGLLVRNNTDPLNAWFVNEYKKRYGAYPVGASYQYGKAILFLKLSMDKAAKMAGQFPTQAQIIAAGRQMEFRSFGGMVRMALGGGRQAIHRVGYGVTKWNAKKGEPGITSVRFYNADCINPPPGTLAADWLTSGMPGAGARCK